MAVRKERNRHLTDDQRLALEAALRERKPFAQVSRETGDPPLDDQEGGHEPPRGVDEDRFNPCARPDRPSPLPSYFLNRQFAHNLNFVVYQIGSSAPSLRPLCG